MQKGLETGPLEVPATSVIVRHGQPNVGRAVWYIAIVKLVALAAGGGA